jgi:uncharacterized cupin superfamily protein
MNSYDAGDPVRLQGTFQNSGGTLVTPGAVTLHLVPPVQGKVVPGTVEYTLAQGSLTAPSAGTVYRDLLPVPSGTWGVWTYSFVGSGPYAVFVDQFFVRQPPRG